MMRRRKELLRGHGEDLASGGIGWRFQQEPEISKFSRFLFYLFEYMIMNISAGQGHRGGPASRSGFEASLITAIGLRYPCP
jgi:hypothetical protein